MTFDLKAVNEERAGWKIEKHKSGRKLAKNTVDGREVAVWVSDLKEFDGNYPIRGKYLLPYPQAIIEKEICTGSEILWVTKKQYQRMTRCLEPVARNTVFEHIVPFLGKVFQRLAEFIEDGLGVESALVDLVMDTAFQKILDELDDMVGGN